MNRIFRFSIKFSCVFGYFLIHSYAQAASFNCQNASTLVEYTICSYPAIGYMDKKVEQSYKDALAASKDASAVQAEQRKWVAERNRCTSLNCLISAYQKRSQALTPPWARAEKTAPWIAGVYDATQGRIDLVQVDVRKIAFRVFAISDRGNMGTLNDGVAQLFGDVAKHVDARNDCALTMHLKPKTITVSQRGGCGFGISVGADGEYRLSENQAPIIQQLPLESKF